MTINDRDEQYLYGVSEMHHCFKAKLSYPLERIKDFFLKRDNFFIKTLAFPPKSFDWDKIL